MTIIILLVAIHLAICLFTFSLGRKVQASDDKVIIDQLVASDKKHLLQSENFRSELGVKTSEYSELLRLYAVVRRKYYDKYPIRDSDEHDEDMLLNFEYLSEFKSEAQASGLTLEEYLILHFKPKQL